MHILVVDDSTLHRTLMREMLQRHLGATVEAFSDGQSALRAVEGGGFDLAIVDLTMPGMGGAAVCAALRARRNPPPVVIMSADDSASARHIATRAGASALLPKSCKADVLRAVIASVTGSA